MKNKITLITGAAGFIGFHTSIHLLKKRKKVIGIDFKNFEKSIKEIIMFEKKNK